MSTTKPEAEALVAGHSPFAPLDAGAAGSWLRWRIALGLKPETGIYYDDALGAFQHAEAEALAAGQSRGAALDAGAAAQQAYLDWKAGKNKRSFRGATAPRKRGQSLKARELPPAATASWATAANNLRERRIGMGWTQRDLADQLDLGGTAQVSNWETLEAIPRVGSWLRWRIALGLPPMPAADLAPLATEADLDTEAFERR
jgi:hypothetical protein